MEQLFSAEMTQKQLFYLNSVKNYWNRASETEEPSDFSLPLPISTFFDLRVMEIKDFFPSVGAIRVAPCINDIQMGWVALQPIWEEVVGANRAS